MACSRSEPESLSRAIDPDHRLYLVSRHFVWLGPLANLLLFLVIGLLLAVAASSRPRGSGWIASRLLFPSPSFRHSWPRVVKSIPEAWFVLALGFAAQDSALDRAPSFGLARTLWLSFPAMVAAVLCLASLVFVGDRLKQRRETGRPMPPANSPNVLLVVLDTVRADHLSLYGYGRSTAPNLERLAKLGIRFDEARATAPWTLPSHASIFTVTGRMIWSSNG